MGLSRFSILPLGLHETELRVLKVAISMLGDEGLACRVLDTPAPDTHLVILDGDSEAGRDALHDLDDRQVKLVMADETVTGRNVIYIAKPVRVAELHQVLLRISRYLKPPEETAAPGATAEKDSETGPDASRGAECDHPLYDSVFYRLLQCKQQQSCAQISDGHGTSIFINGASRTVVTRGEPAQIDALLAEPLSTLTVVELHCDGLASHPGGHHIVPIDSLLWEAAIRCSRGSLLPGHSPETAIRLKAWPNFPRRGFKQAYFKLAAILARRATSLRALAAETHIPFDVVAAFYNAVSALGLVDKGAAKPAVKKRGRPDENRRNLLHKLAKRLGID